MNTSRATIALLTGSGDRLTQYVRLMRPYQWTKNLAVFPPLIFSFNLIEGNIVVASVLTFLSFCIVSSSVYALNDVIDAERDRGHPKKRLRPVAGGAIRKPGALVFSLALFILGLGLAYHTHAWLTPVVAAYWLTNLLYSLVLKRVVLVDVMSIALGFVTRVIGGTIICLVPPSSWLLLVTFFLALFLAFGKRRQELQVQITEEGSRLVLGEYDFRMLDQFLPVLAGLVVITYALFAISDYATARFGSTLLIYTVPFVVYGLFRYIYLMHRHGEGEDPSVVLLKDRAMIVCIALWALTSVFIIYWDKIVVLAKGVEG